MAQEIRQRWQQRISSASTDPYHLATASGLAGPQETQSIQEHQLHEPLTFADFKMAVPEELKEQPEVVVEPSRPGLLDNWKVWIRELGDDPLGNQVFRVACLVAICFGILLLNVAVSSLQSFQSRPQPGTTLAAQTVTDFYRAVNGGAYSAAYNYLSSSWRKELSSDQFEAGFHGAEKVYCQFLSVEALSAREARVEVILNVDDGRAYQNIRCNYKMVLEEGTWKLDNRQIVGS